MDSEEVASFPDGSRCLEIFKNLILLFLLAPSSAFAQNLGLDSGTLRSTFQLVVSQAHHSQASAGDQRGRRFGGFRSAPCHHGAAPGMDRVGGRSRPPEQSPEVYARSGTAPLRDLKSTGTRNQTLKSSRLPPVLVAASEVRVPQQVPSGLSTAPGGSPWVQHWSRCWIPQQCAGPRLISSLLSPTWRPLGTHKIDV